MKKLLYFLTFVFITQISYGQTENYWIKKTDFAGLKRERAVSFSINGKGYVGTGVDTTEMVRRDFWSYDPTLNTWTQVADFGGIARRNAIAFAINNKGYVGTGMSHAESALGSTLADLWEYDPDLNTWIQKANFPANFGQGIYFATAFAVNNKAYICGGKRGPADYTDEMWEYNPLTNSWIQKSPFPGGVRYQHCSFSIGDRGYVGLGIDLDIYRKDLWEYNPASDTWAQKSDFLGSERGAVSTFSFNHRGYICLGSDGGLKKDLWEYNPYDNSWSIRAPFGGSARKNAISFVIGDTAYVGTGKGVTGKKMSFYAYHPYASSFVSNNNQTTTITLKTYPNPIINQFTIETDPEYIKTIQIYNITGQIVFSMKVESSKTVIQQLNLASGAYFLIGKDEMEQVILTQKIIFK
ncbi:MAG TPA: T9SS type A sorting domain-containing protein [Crocinitomix sp.]|nr:T9SS type A sorting domain-containing protein [Crocinitomix sp.]